MLPKNLLQRLTVHIPANTNATAAAKLDLDDSSHCAAQGRGRRFWPAGSRLRIPPWHVLLRIVPSQQIAAEAPASRWRSPACGCQGCGRQRDAQLAPRGLALSMTRPIRVSTPPVTEALVRLTWQTVETRSPAHPLIANRPFGSPRGQRLKSGLRKRGLSRWPRPPPGGVESDQPEYR